MFDATTDADKPQLEKLTGDDTMKSEGAWVFTDQGVASEQGFRNVSRYWYPQTLSYEDGLKKLEEGRSATEDIMATVSEMSPSVTDKGEFAFTYKDGRQFVPTEHALNQLGTRAGTGTWFVNALRENPVDQKKRQLFKRDRMDAETLAFALKNGLRRLDPAKRFLWRTRQDGTLRAMLTDRFAIVDNRWFIETLAKLVPGGRLSHWKGDGSDTIYGNILIPDTIREEKDSDYGGMLSIGNSEIGERRVSSRPSIFRAICMNGCIWGAKKGKGIKQVHRGRIDLTQLAQEIKVNLELQIPLLPQGIERLLGTRVKGWDGVDAKAVVAAAAGNFKLGKKAATAVLAAYLVEQQQTPDYARTLFSLANAFTRAGQELTPNEWVQFDEYAGVMTGLHDDKAIVWGDSDWNRLLSNAKTMKKEEVEEMFSNAA
jgi:hypothetical protein